MNILIIGNGFDLAHRMKTRYSDFLDFLKVIREKEELNYIYNYEKYIKENKIELEEEILKELYKNIKKNIWYDYFFCIYNEKNMNGENWIDFEKEIRDIIEIIDKHENNLQNKISIEKMKKYKENLFEGNFQIFLNCWESLYPSSIENSSLEQFLEISYDALIRLIDCLEIYLRIEEKKLEKRKEGIVGDVGIPRFDLKSIDKVLCFNYTHTFSKLYKKEEESQIKNREKICYIHGQIRPAKSYIKLENNMIIGIDEYYDDERKNTNTNFNIFKKFTQRIIKETDLGYRDWLEEINKEDSWDKKLKIDKKRIIHNVYVFGHSLDITDKDILKDFIYNENVKTTVYYYEKQQQVEQVANLVKLLGQDKFIKMFKEKRIEFRKQSKMEKVQ